MTSEATGTGQPSRTLALLWGEPAATGRRKGPARSVDVSQVVEAAQRPADLDRFETGSRGHTAAELVEHLAQGKAEWNFHDSRLLHAAPEL